MNDTGTGGSGGSRLRSTWVLVFGRAPWFFPCALILAGVMITLASPGHSTFAATFAAAPLVAAALWTFSGTLAVGAVALGTMTALMAWSDQLSTYEGIVRLITGFSIAVLSPVVNRAIRRSELRLASTRQIAEAAQLAVLPTPPGRIDGLSFAARYEAAHTGARIGGDMYAVQKTPYGVRMLVGDVCGKGLITVEAVTVVLGAFREAADRESDVAAIGDWIEHALRRESGRLGEPERTEEFVTAVLVEIPARAPDRLRIVNRGHPPPLMLSEDGRVRALEPEVYGLPLGLGDLAQAAQDRPQEVLLSPGALLLLYTDGVTEAQDAKGAFYDPVARLTGRDFTGPGALLDALLADVEHHTGGATADDMALLAVTRAPAPPTSGRTQTASARERPTGNPVPCPLRGSPD